MILGPNEFIGGLLSLLYVIVSPLMGILVMSRYFKYKEKAFIFIGLSIGAIACPWWPSAVSFLSHVLFNQLISVQLYFFLGNAFAPIFTYIWLIGMNILLFDGKNKKFLAVYAIIFSMMEIIFLLLLFLAPTLIGDLDPFHLNVDYHGFMMIFLIMIVITIVSTGLTVAIRTMKSQNPLIKLKGRVLFFSFVIWAVAATFDSSIPMPIVGVIIVRTMLIFHTIGFYIGWIMPQFAQKFFTKINLLKEE